MNENNYLQNLSSAYPLLSLSLDFKVSPQDFVVDEELSFTCSGEGEHFYVQVRKTQLTTLFVFEQLSKWAKVSPKNISYAGLKDKQGITTQWFSIWLPGKTLPDKFPEVEGLELLNITKHSKKLKRGAIKHNHFTIRLNGSHFDPKLVVKRLQLINEQGVPNYYGSQRFGRDKNNVVTAIDKLSSGKVKRQEKSILISSVRSFIFNLILSLKVKEGVWREVISGQPLQLFGSRSWFLAEGSSEEVVRVLSGDCSPTTELYSHKFQCIDTYRSIIIKRYPELTNLLDKIDLSQDLRSNILRPIGLNYEVDEAGVNLSFSLLTGCYATSVLRELASDIN